MLLKLIKDAYVLIDGYNVINSWGLLSELKDIELAEARDKFADLMADYAGYKNLDLFIVFDAYMVKSEFVMEKKAGITIVFTDEGETADSFIEKKAYEFLRLGKDVFVVTGDLHEQFTILGMGAYRITPGELFEDYNKTKKEAQKETEKIKDTYRHEIAERIGKEAFLKLEELRRIK